MMRLATSCIALALLASPAQPEPELGGRDGLTARCLTTPGNSRTFCTCLAERAVSELPADMRQFLWAAWGHPTVFNFRAAMTPNDLAEIDEKTWGPWQRRAVPACNASAR